MIHVRNFKGKGLKRMYRYVLKNIVIHTSEIVFMSLHAKEVYSYTFILIYDNRMFLLQQFDVWSVALLCYWCDSRSTEVVELWRIRRMKQIVHGLLIAHLRSLDELTKDMWSIWVYSQKFSFYCVKSLWRNFYPRR